MGCLKLTYHSEKTSLSLIPGRCSDSQTFAGGYIFGFNGKEKDNETYGDGNEYDFGARIYNPRIARFFSVDPLANKFAWNSPYAYSENRPIDGIDLDGKEWCKASYFDPFLQGEQVVTTVKVNVMDATGTNMTVSQMTEIMNGIRGQSAATFSQFDKETNTNYTTILEYEFVPFEKAKTGEYNLQENFTMLFKNTKSDANGGFEGGSTALLGGQGGTQKNILRVNSNVDGNMRPIADIVRTGVHELGHSGGLLHPWESPSLPNTNTKLNIMNSGANPDPAIRINSSEAASATQSTTGQVGHIATSIDQDLAGEQ